MCANYTPAPPPQVRVELGLRGDFEMPPEVYPGQGAAMLRRAPDGTLEYVPSVFGLLPPWAERMILTRHTYNARIETVAEKPSYRAAWRKRQFCAVPMQAFFEPRYDETDRATRWRISRGDGALLYAAGLWEWRPPRDGQGALLSHTLLTVNADHSMLMRQFHGPMDEKRSIVALPRERVHDWLAAAADAQALLVAIDGDDFVAEAAPRKTRSPVPAVRRKPE